uniref:Uncharacterized protein n=1 Tax=Kalanchoe fedtschenkoi TaxID=63787 RepID=A0A7N0TR96_KALFE
MRKEAVEWLLRVCKLYDFSRVTYVLGIGRAHGEAVDRSVGNGRLLIAGF